MKVQHLVLLVLVVGLAGLASLTKAAESKAQAFIDAAQAGPDFSVQGEYLGELTTAAGKQKLGAQVMAQGAGKFNAVLQPGGLPGEGWDGKIRIELSGKREADKTALTSTTPAGYSATITGETLTGQNDKGEKFELKKVLRKSPTEGLQPPAGAVVLFDGKNTEKLTKARIVEGNLLAEGPITKDLYKDFTLHCEFRLPFMPTARGQGRANSGVYLQYRYEIQVLDSFGLPPANNFCGAVYTKIAPSIMMCYPPLSWQTYDIDFTAAKFDAAGNKVKNARVTVKLNGVAVQNDTEMPSKTGAGHKEEPTGGPIWFQDHGNPVYFRNMWLVEKK